MISRRWLFVACYAASGAAALVYQVVWVRTMTLAFGHTVASSSIVLGAFMCGLAVGAWVVGRSKLAADRALVVYAGLELVIAAVAIALPMALSAFQPVLSWAYADGTLPVRFSLVRAGICFILLGLPAAAMGATFPVAVAWVAGRAADAGPRTGAHTMTRAGVLYTANTAGAAAGALAAGFWLIPSYGVQIATWGAVGLNVLAASGALWLRQHEKGTGTFFAPPAKAKKVPVPFSALAGGAVAVSGFAALVFEVAWTRLIAAIIGPTTYAFSIMAASFIVGIAIGSALGVRLARASRPRAVVWLSAALVVSAAATLAAAWFAALEGPLMIARYVTAAAGFRPLLLREAVLIGTLVISASVLFGTTFTLALAVSSPGDDSAPRTSSIVYAANTIGAVLGSLAAGFFLIPRFGLASTFVQTSRMLLAAGTVVAALSLYRRTVRGPGAAVMALSGAALFAGTFALPAWNDALLASGLYKYARQIDPEDFATSVRAGRLEYYKEGPAGAVSVRMFGGTRSLAIDGKVDASNGGDMLTQRLLGLLPALLHPNPQEALVIGLGTGVTADAVMASGTISRMDIVEISPEVVEASALFEAENRGVLQSPRVRLLIGDGRTHLQLTPRRYDIIVSEPSNPWMAGVAALFTQEFFQTVRARLTDNGIFCQWAHTYEIEADDLRSIVQTFTSVFPQGTLWLVGDADLLLIGTRADALGPQLSVLPGRMRGGEVTALLADAGVAAQSVPFFVSSLYAGGGPELASYGQAAGIQSDDRMDLEFTAARAMYAPPEGNAPGLRALRNRAALPASLAAVVRDARAADWIARGEAGVRIEAFGMAHESFRRAAALESASVEALRGAVTAAAAMGTLDEETRWLRERATEQPDSAEVRAALSYSLALGGDVEGAVAAALDATRLEPDSAEALEQLASVLADSGDPRLASVADTLVARFPERKDSRFYKATALVLQNHPYDAEAELDALFEIHPRHAKARNLAGIICAGRRDFACAASAFEAALKLDPRDSAVYVNLGNLYLQQGDARAAAQLFSEAVALDPGAESARIALRTIAGASQ